MSNDSNKGSNRERVEGPQRCGSAASRLAVFFYVLVWLTAALPAALFA